MQSDKTMPTRARRPVSRRALASCAALAACCLVAAGCGRASGFAKTLTENAVIAIEFFPEGSQIPSKNRIHSNYRYLSKGRNLIVKVDDWEFKGGRKNRLIVYTVALSELDPEGCRIQEPPFPVGPISYKGVRVPIKPKTLILRTNGQRPVIRAETYDRGAGSSFPNEDDRWRGTGEPIREEAGEIRLYAPNPERAQRIIDALGR